MKKYIFLMGMVALMSSCSGDIYDNIKEFVDSETVYPAGYDQTKVSLMAGYDRVEIYLMGDSSRPEPDKPYLAKAIKTVVKWGEGPNDKREFTPARSWVNVTGLTVAQNYHFEIYTEDEFGNTSAPVTISGKPFNKADESLLVIANIMVSANTSQAVINPTLAPESYAITGGEYSFTVGGVLRSETFTDPRVVFQNLSVGETYNVQLTYNLVPVGVLDTVPVTYDVEVKTMTVAELDEYINSTSPFPPTSDDLLGNPYYVTSAAPFVISGGAYDFGAAGVALKRVNNSSNSVSGKNSWNYRASVTAPAGMANVQGGVDYSSIDDNASTPPLVGIGAMAPGDWWVYTVEVVDAGMYKLEYNRTMAMSRNGWASLFLDNLDVLGNIEITRNGDWSRWEWEDPHIEVRLTAGKHKLKWMAGADIYTHGFGGLRLTYQRPL